MPPPCQIPGVPKITTAQNTAEQAEDDVFDYAIATTLHDLASKPTGDESNNNPCDKSHLETLLWCALRHRFRLYEHSSATLQ